MATASQSCGLSALLMVLHSSMKKVATQTILYVKQKKKSSVPNADKNLSNNEQLLTAFTTIGLSAMLPGMWCIVASLSPFAAFQWFGFAAFCKLQSHELATFPAPIIKYGEVNNFTMPGGKEKPSWCYLDPPIPYYHLGDFAFKEPFIHWVPEEWPHYVACAPAFVLVLWQLGHFFKVHKRYCLRLGLVDNSLLGMAKPKSQSWIVSRFLFFIDSRKKCSSVHFALSGHCREKRSFTFCMHFCSSCQAFPLDRFRYETYDK